MDWLSPAADLLASEAAPDGAAAAVLREVAAMMQQLARDPDFGDAIDLLSLPLGDAGRAQLRARLGTGEVEATLQLGGSTRIHETAYAGAWWVQRHDDGGRALFEQIVIARVPALLCAHPEDAGAAAQRLAAELAASPSEESP
jgi:hydrogenase-1 operon protein HyaF